MPVLAQQNGGIEHGVQGFRLWSFLALRQPGRRPSSTSRVASPDPHISKEHPGIGGSWWTPMNGDDRIFGVTVRNIAIAFLPTIELFSDIH